MHDADFSESRLHTSTPKPSAPQIAAPRRDSHAHLESIRKRPRTAIRITSAASSDHTRPAARETASEQRVSWASRAINCCAMTSRKASPQVCTRAPPPQREENAPTRSKQPARDDRRDPRDDSREPAIFTFDSCAIAAFARETAARDAHGAMTRDYASQRVHATRESTGRALLTDTAAALAAHDSCEPRSHIITRAHRDSNYLHLNAANSSLRSRRLTRPLPRTPSSSSSSSRPPTSSNFIANTTLDPISRAAPTSRSISLAAVSANSFSPPMDPRDATEVFSTAALGFVDFRVACEVLRSCEAMDLFIRGLDAQFRRDIARSGCNSIRELLRARFAKLPETLRALYEYAIVDCCEAAPAMTVSSSGRREESTLCRLHVRSCSAALAIAEMVRREFTSRPEHEAPQILIVAHKSSPRAESEPPPSSSAPAPANIDASGAPALEEPAGTTPPDSGTASSSSQRPVDCASPRLRHRLVAAADLLHLAEDGSGSRSRRHCARRLQRRETRRGARARALLAAPVPRNVDSLARCTAVRGTTAVRCATSR